MDGAQRRADAVLTVPCATSAQTPISGAQKGAEKQRERAAPKLRNRTAINEDGATMKSSDHADSLPARSIAIDRHNGRFTRPSTELNDLDARGQTGHPQFDPRIRHPERHASKRRGHSVRSIVQRAVAWVAERERGLTAHLSTALLVQSVCAALQVLSEHT